MLPSYRPDVREERWANEWWVTSYHENHLVPKHSGIGCDFTRTGELDEAYRWSMFAMYWPAIAIYALVGLEKKT